VFVGDDTILRMDDSQYHARRAEYTFVHFPQVLHWDPYLNYPDGADVPWPPLYDFILGAASRLFAEDVEEVPAVLAWASVAFGTLTALLVYALARSVSPPWTALGAAALFALLPASTIYSQVGNADHHAAVAAIGTALLALHTRGVDPATSGRSLAAVHAVLVPTRLAILLLWHGSIVYLAVAELTVVAVLAGGARRDALRAQAIGALTTALLVSPVIMRQEPGLGGPFSPIELSRLHIAALLAVAIVAAGTVGLDSWRPAAAIPRRLLRLAALAGVAALALFLVPGVLAGLQHAIEYASKQSDWIAGNTESQPIFRNGSASAAVFLFGGFAFLLPLAPLGPLARARDPRVRAPSIVLAGWTTFFGALALSQSRYGNDFAPAGAVSIALLLNEAGAFAQRRAARASRLLGALPVVAALLLAWPLIHTHARLIPGATAHLLGKDRTGDAPPGSAHETVHRFAKQIRQATPPTSGYFDPSAAPEYGVLSFAGIGHAIQRVARRPTPSDNFGPYLAGSRLNLANRFYALTDEQRAVRLSQRLSWRYVGTAAEGLPRASRLLHRLHWADGTDRFGAPRLERFRLVTEGPRGGISIGNLRRPNLKDDIPYKLFEIVSGAVLRVRSEPGSTVIAEVTIGTPTGRRFDYRATAGADADGLARIRVPYATDTEAPARPLGPYRLRSAGREYAVTVSDADVRIGTVMDVGASSAGASTPQEAPGPSE
jgi:dolichyl-diphosphooligosaccharide--protein glycosyltransferase